MIRRFFRKFIKLIKKPKVYMPIIMILTPIIIGFVYHWFFKTGAELQPNEVLIFYGTCITVFGGYVAYLEKQDDKQIEKDKSSRPNLTVTLKKNKNIFTLKVINNSAYPLKYWYLYNRYVSEALSDEETFTLTFNESTEVANKNKSRYDNYYNITIDENILDNDGYPKCIQITGECREKRDWDCMFNKIVDGSEIYYYPDVFTII